MKIKNIKPPRKFLVGKNKIEILHKADIFLDDNELITLFTNKKMNTI